MKQFHFTKKDILKLPKPKKGMTSYRDTKEKGLSLYITASGAKTFFVRKRVNGRDERIILGSFPETSIENARNKALNAKAEIANGKNPNHEKRKMRSEITFKELFDEYMNRYSKKEKKSWQYDEREVNRFLSHWFKRRISSITKHEIQILHEKIRDENGLYQANRILERISSIFNKAIDWGWDGKNPAKGIKKHPEKSRQRFIQPHEMPFIFEAIDQEDCEIARDYFWLSLLTGARKSNILSMKWDQIIWERQEWYIPETKNGDSIHIPLTERAISILEDRRGKTNSEWVLPSPSSRSKTGHLADPKKAWGRVLKRASLLLWQENQDIAEIIKAENRNDNSVDTLFKFVSEYAKRKNIKLSQELLDIRLHDIRRTFGSYQAIAGASLPIIGKSLGHKSQHATQIYSKLHLDPVRRSMNIATDKIFKAGNK